MTPTSRNLKKKVDLSCDMKKHAISTIEKQGI